MELAFLHLVTSGPCKVCKTHCARQDRVKLAGIKNTLYNPHLVTYQQSERDNIKGKLPDEHSRTTLPKAVADLPPELFYNYNPSCSYVPRYDSLPLPSKWIREEGIKEKLSLERNEELKRAYLKFRGHLPLPKGRLVQIPQVREFHFLNYKVRYLRPEERQKWRDHILPDSTQTDVPNPCPGLCRIKETNPSELSFLINTK